MKKQQLAISKKIIGKRIVAVGVNPFKDGRGGYAFDPMLILEDGSSIAFMVQETDVDRYSVKMVYDPPSKDGEEHSG